MSMREIMAPTETWWGPMSGLLSSTNSSRVTTSASTITRSTRISPDPASSWAWVPPFGSASTQRASGPFLCTGQQALATVFPECGVGGAMRDMFRKASRRGAGIHARLKRT